MRCVYLDLDGTLLGRNASLLHDGDGAVSLLGMRAIEACLRADLEVVLTSGRRRAQVAEPPQFERPGNIVLVQTATGIEAFITGTEPGIR